MHASFSSSPFPHNFTSNFSPSVGADFIKILLQYYTPGEPMRELEEQRIQEWRGVSAADMIAVLFSLAYPVAKLRKPPKLSVITFWENK